MRGHQDIIKMRMSGYAPKGIWVNHGQDKNNFCLSWSKYDDLIAFPEVEILPIENINQLDLRYSVGLTVHVSSKQSLEKAKKLHDAFVQAKAMRVITCCDGFLIDSLTGVHSDYIPE